MPHPGEFYPGEHYPGSLLSIPTTTYDVPKFKMPFRVTEHIQLVEQDSIDEIGQCVYVVLATPLGSRAVDPKFGLDDQAHVKNGARLEDLTDAIEASEPRVTELDFESEWDGVKQRVRTVIG